MHTTAKSPWCFKHRRLKRFKFCTCELFAVVRNNFFQVPKLENICKGFDNLTRSYFLGGCMPLGMKNSSRCTSGCTYHQYVQRDPLLLWPMGHEVKVSFEVVCTYSVAGSIHKHCNLQSCVQQLGPCQARRNTLREIVLFSRCLDAFHALILEFAFAATEEWRCDFLWELLPRRQTTLL